MSETKKNPFTFRMRQLPKAEYKLLKQFVEKYNLADQSEAMLIALRCVYEISCFDPPHGKQWLVHIINAWKSNPTEEREYILEQP